MENQPAGKIPLNAKIGLALGGGAARGLSHLGVIKALTGAGLDFHCIAGTSIGALVGAVYACGGIDTLHEVALQVDWMRMASFLDIGGSRSGLLSGRRVTEFLHDYLKSHKIEEVLRRFKWILANVLLERQASKSW